MHLYEATDEPSKTRLSESMLVRYIVAVIAAWSAEAVSYPFDLTKTRLQIQNEVATAKFGYKMENRGMIKTAIHIAQHEGIHKLWSGMMAMWQRHAIYSGCRVLFYERLRNLSKDQAGNVSILATTICGMTAGALSQVIASPTDLVKIQMQGEGRRVLQGKPPRFTNSLQVYKMIYRESGVTGFWRGVVPNAQRAALTTLGTIAGYDYSKRFLKRNLNLPEGLILHTSAAFISGFLAAGLSTPTDVIKTRLMNQPVGKDGKGQIYAGYMDCVRQTLKNEGIISLYKGFLPVWMRLGPWGLVNWLVFENVMRAVGGKAF